MRPGTSTRIYTDIPLLILYALAFLALPGGKAAAADSPGLYVGAAIGQSHVNTTASVEEPLDIFPGPQTEEVDANHAAFQVMLGARPISWVGAELDYIDFGKASGGTPLYGSPTDASLKGEAAFGVLYLPLRVVDLYLKAGVARLRSTVNGSACGPCECAVCTFAYRQSRTNTGGAAGAGIQYRIGRWALRAEYERFNAAGGNPSLLSAGVSWTFF